MISHFGMNGYVQIKGTIIFISGLLFGGLAMSFVNGWIMANVRPNENLKKVSLLVVDGQIFTSPPKTMLESIEKRFFIILYKTGIYKNAIQFHNKRRGKALFTTYMSIISLALVVGVFLSVTLTFGVDPAVTSEMREKNLLKILDNLTD
jgi:hypothetical protein